MPQQHRLAGPSRVDLRKLNGEAYVHFPRRFAPYLYDQIEDLWRRNDVKPDILQETAEWLTIVGLVEAGLGVSLVPASFAKLKWGGVVYRELSTSATSTVTTVCLPMRGCSAAAEAFFEEARALSVR